MAICSISLTFLFFCLDFFSSNGFVIFSFLPDPVSHFLYFPSGFLYLHIYPIFLSSLPFCFELLLRVVLHIVLSLFY